MNQTAIILTATVNPIGPIVAQNSPAQRLAEYEESLQFYAERLPHDLIVVENSGFNPETSKVAQALIDSGRLQWMAFAPSSNPEKGKGFQEFEMLDGAVAQLAGKYDSFVKITGRYLVPNAKDLIGRAPKGIRIDRHRKMKVAITGFFQCRTEFYLQNLSGIYRNADDTKGVFIEHVLYDVLARIPEEQIELFRQNPDYRGVSGSHGNSMQRHPLKMKMRNIERRLLQLAGKREFLIEY